MVLEAKFMFVQTPHRRVLEMDRGSGAPLGAWAASGQGLSLSSRAMFSTYGCSYTTLLLAYSGLPGPGHNHRLAGNGHATSAHHRTLKFRPAAWWARWLPPTVPGNQQDFTVFHFILPNKINLQNEYISKAHKVKCIFVINFPCITVIRNYDLHKHVIKFCYSKSMYAKLL